MSIRKFRAGRTTTTSATDYVGEYGSIFWDESIGELRLSDGETPGGLPVMGGAGPGGLNGITSEDSTKTLYVDASWNVIPNTDKLQSLGNITHLWKDIYSSSIHIGSATISEENGVLVLPSSTTVGGATVPKDIRDLTDTTNLLFNKEYSNLSGAPTSLLDFNIVDGAMGQVLTTNGSGVFTFANIPGGTAQLSWADYTTNWQSEPAWVATIAQGEVYQYVYSNQVAYRLIPATSNDADSFYRSFSNNTLTTLLAKRGDL